MNVMVIVNSIDSIITEDGTEVTDVKLIREFIYNCDRNVFNSIKDKIDTLGKQQKIQPLNITCDSCSAVYESDVTFEQSNFFV